MAHATPHSGMAADGSSSAAFANAFAASSWLNPNTKSNPRSKAFCASGLFVAIAW